MSPDRLHHTSRAQTAARSLAMLAALQEDDASREQLIAVVESELGADAYGSSPEDSFTNDKQFLADLGFDIHYHKRENTYHLRLEAHPLLRLSLSAEELEALPLVQRAFAETPYADAVNRLVQRIRDHLPPHVRERETDPLFTLTIARLDVLAPHAQTLRLMREAISHHRLFEFEYRSPKSGRQRRHSVQVYDRLEYRDGHLYFEACPLNWSKTVDYRIDRIVPGSARLLPNKLPAGPRKPEMLPLRYWLSKEVARYGASRRFAEHTEHAQDDGSMTVAAQVARTDLFWASKTLLKYGENCTVLEPPELVAEMRRVVRAMGANYGDEG